MADQIEHAFKLSLVAVADGVNSFIDVVDRPFVAAQVNVKAFLRAGCQFPANDHIVGL